MSCICAMPTTRSARQSHPSAERTPKIKKELVEPPKSKVWEPARFLSYEEYTSKPGNPYAVVILNQPIENVNLFIQICSQGEKMFHIYAIESTDS